MAVYVCKVCGYTFDEEREGVTLDEYGKCPLCGAEQSNLEPLAREERPVPDTAPESNVMAGEIDLDYAMELRRRDDRERHMLDIHQMAVSGESIIEAMGTPAVRPAWEDILLLGGQLDPMPLAHDAPVCTRTVIGRGAKRPLEIETPVFISHMSFGALSREVKVALARGASMAGTAMCSGEGGILPQEREAADKYIFEYVPNRYSDTDENLQRADAIEIKIGQGTKPGMGGHLPGAKVTPEIAQIRGRRVGEDVISPSGFPDIHGPENLRGLVDSLRARSGGRPIGVKVAAGRIERDLAVIARSGADFVTLDGRGGATGASPKLVRDATSVPTIYALHRARAYMDAHGMEQTLIITGGLRVSSDFAKALAMGADAVAIASAALIAAACQQYKLCNSGLCPVGVATQDEDLRSRLNVEASAKRVGHFLQVSTQELKTFARIAGHRDVHGLSIDDLCTVDSEISGHTRIPHA